MTHSVYFWLRDDLSAEDSATFESELLKLPSIESVKTGHIAKSAGTPERPVTDKSFSYYLHLEFDSVDAHNAYQVDPAHDHFVDSCKTMWEKVVIYDTEAL